MPLGCYATIGADTGHLTRLVGEARAVQAAGPERADVISASGHGSRCLGDVQH